MSMSNRGRRRAAARVTRRRVISATASVGLVATLTTGCWAEPSAMPAVRDFLIAWQVGNYEAAAGRTIGADREAVEQALGQVRAQLDAASLRLALGVPGQDTSTKAIDKNGNKADARFSVKVDLGENGQPWTYTGLMRLERVGGKWKVVWDPSIINPQLKPGQRLAVRTEVPRRALITDAQGGSLLRDVPAVNIGVFPGRLQDPQRTLEQLAKVTKIDGGRRLDAERLLGRVKSAPPQQFLPLLTLQQPAHNALIHQLGRVAGLELQQVKAPIAPTIAPELIGTLGPATSDRLQQVGAPYQPGDTIGISGLQLLQQRRLAGTPTVRVVAQDPGGQNTEELRAWEGQQPQDVQTTLARNVQLNADGALAGLRYPASLVALRPSTGEVWAVANHGTGGRNLAFEGKYPPGMTFGIVSAEALLSHAGMDQDTKTTCPGKATVGDQTFTNRARPDAAFGAHFALACRTTLAQLSGRLDGKTLLGEAARLGIGKNWGLSVPAFSGTVPVPTSDAQKAAIMVGQGGVQVSPLTMALVAAAAQNGTWKPPYVLQDLTNPAEQPPAQNLQPESISNLKQMLRRTVTAGVAGEVNGRGDIAGMTDQVTYQEGGRSKTVSWFVGSRGDLAFAVAVEGPASAAQIAARFLSTSPTTATRTPAR